MACFTKIKIILFRSGKNEQKKKKRWSAIISISAYNGIQFHGRMFWTTSASSGSTSQTAGSSGSTSGGSLQKVTLQLKWLPQSQFMGYYIAQEKGYYKDEGIDISILPGGSDIIPEQQVSNGVANIGVTWTSSLMKYQAKGWNLVETAQIFQKSAMLLVSKKSSNITSVKDFKGKNIGSWFGGNEYELYALLGKYGLDKDKDVKLVQQDFTMNQLESGKIDVAQAMTYNEYGLLLEAGHSDSDLNKIDVNTEGVAITIFKLLKEEFMRSFKTKIGAILLKNNLKKFKDRFDYTEVGGAPFLGINGIMIKAHGSSDAKTIKNAIRQAKLLYDNGCVDTIRDEISKLGVESANEQA
jgi:NitT/TauT family transport system substrate-binding protein